MTSSAVELEVGIPGEPESDSPYARCDLCIIGAGVAGLNALFSASTYLSKAHRVILIDQNPSAGGMWTQTYDYVRLHQPHRMFTAGNIPWTLDREPSYLATKPEVAAHLEHCLDTLRERVDLLDLYGYTYTGHREVAVGDGYGAEVVCHPAGDDEKPLHLHAKRLIKAFGYHVRQNPPLALSSGQVRSVSPHTTAFLGPEMDASDEPVYIIGGGKTAMDSAHALIQRYPRREIHLIAGAGTAFLNRNQSFPKGLKRWWGGNTGFRVFRDLALRYDGDNEAEVFEHFKRTYATGPSPASKYYMFGLLSEEENAVISAGLSEIVMDYLSDIVDVDGKPIMTLRSGETTAVEPGSWVVNCTGHLMKQPRPYEPYLSEHGAVLSIQGTSAIHFLTTFASYFLTHLFFLEKLPSLPLYELDQQALAAKNKAAWPFACATQAFYNLILILDVVPSRVMQELGLDFDRWYPPPRRLLNLLKLKRNARRDAEHCKRSLDRVRERYGVRCGVLEKGPPPSQTEAPAA